MNRQRQIAKVISHLAGLDIPVDDLGIDFARVFTAKRALEIRILDYGDPGSGLAFERLAPHVQSGDRR